MVAMVPPEAASGASYKLVGLYDTAVAHHTSCTMTRTILRVCTINALGLMLFNSLNFKGFLMVPQEGIEPPTHALRMPENPLTVLAY